MGSNEGDVREYPRWEKHWQNRLSDVDKQITDYYQREGREGASDGNGLTRHVQHWFDKQALDDDTRAEYNATRHDDGYWRERLDHRVEGLRQQGLLGGQSMQQGQSGAAAGAVSTGGQYGPQGQSSSGAEYGQHGQYPGREVAPDSGSLRPASKFAPADQPAPVKGQAQAANADQTPGAASETGQGYAAGQGTNPDRPGSNYGGKP